MSSNPLHFLVADDSKGVRTFLQKLIEGYGFDPQGIRAVSSPEEALQMAAEFKPDFLVTDWFPKASLTGIQLYKKILVTNPRCRLALLSDEVTPRHEAEANAVGSRFLLVKPFTADQLREQIKKALAALMIERPDLIKRMNETMASPAAKARQKQASATASAALAAAPANLPPLPKLKPGDHVVYGGKKETIDYIVLRDGELIAHLSSKTGFVPVSQLRKA